MILADRETKVAAEVLEKLKHAVLEYSAEQAASWARKAIEEGIDPIMVAHALTQAIREVGDGFGRGDLFLPELIGAASAVQNAMPMVREEIAGRGVKRESIGTVVAGTVLGDIHTIGKTMVCTLLTAEGFTVHDLGVDIPAQEFVEAVRKHKADILAMSSLMTMTAPEQKKVIDALKQEGLRNNVKVMVGGAAITEEFAKSIGADGYEASAPGAVRLASRLMEVE
jgi:corrinoid protein of di/trimethylamine methyltransferase